MRAPSLQVKVTMAIVASLLIIGGAGAVVAEYSFREAAEQHAREEAQTRVRAIAAVIDVRLSQLGQVAADAAEDVGEASFEDIDQDMRRAGFSAFVLLDASGILYAGGDAAGNASLVAIMQEVLPSPESPARMIEPKDGWLVVGVRALNRRHVAIGAIDGPTLTNSFFADVLVEATDANAILGREGLLVAQSLTYPLEGGSLAETAPLTRMQGSVTHYVPHSLIEASVDALVKRFIATSVLALALAGMVTVIVTSTSLRSLRQITEAAKRLGRGEEDLRLHVDSKDEMGLLADTLRSSAAALAQADQDLEMAVGDLARSVGQAGSTAEVARRLVDAVSRIAPVRGVAVRRGDAVLDASVKDPADGPAVRALLESDPDGFTWWDMGDGVRLAVLPDPTLAKADERKIKILAAQATLALHRARSLEDLRRARDEKQMFVDILSHDLKNPIAVARGKVELASAREPAAAERLRPVLASLDRATRIIDEAVLFSKLEGRTDVEKPPTDLAGVARDAVAALAPLAIAKGLAVEIIAPSLVVAPANALIGRAVENLVSNAIKWSPAGGRIEVSIEDAGTEARIHVVDHGAGIPAEDRARLFARFERVDRSGVKGVGLGLAIAKRVLDLHAGAIRVEETPGGGSTFVIILPQRGPSQEAIA